jgi:predicted kinase
MDKILYLFRGIPGSGKTTAAKSLGLMTFEADQFFMEDGEYKFDPTKLREAHQWCKYQVEYVMINGMPKVAVSNTFTQEWEMTPYFELASKYGYMVITMVVENRHGGTNEHGVPDDKLEIMKNRFEIKL